MAFRDFSKYIYEFNALDMRLPDKSDQIKYYNKWMRNYSIIFKSDYNFVGIEWDLRCRKALREIFTSATFFIEAKKTLEMSCFSSYYFCLYYSLFHAIYSVIFLDSHLSIENLINVTHRNIINLFHSKFCNAKTDAMSREIKPLFESLKYRREYYSYVTPFNNIFSHEEDMKHLERALIDCYQLSCFHSLLIECSYGKNVGKITRFKSGDEVYEFNKLFNKLFSKQDSNSENLLDPSSKILWGELMKWGFEPEYFVLDLEHQFDEFHTYDNFQEENEHSLNITDIWSFIYSSITIAPEDLK